MVCILPDNYQLLLLKDMVQASNLWLRLPSDLCTSSSVTNILMYLFCYQHSYVFVRFMETNSQPILNLNLMAITSILSGRNAEAKQTTSRPYSTHYL
jgi:hypothetical protein